MRRFSISRLMAIVALLALNFGVIRALIGRTGQSTSAVQQLIVGFLPLLDGVLIALWMLVPRSRIRLRRRPRWERGRFLAIFSAIGGGLLVVAAGSCLFATDRWIEYVEFVGAPTERFLRMVGIDTQTDTLITRYAFLPFFLGLFMSGPPILAAVGLSFGLSRFTIEVTPRIGREPGAEPSPEPVAGTGARDHARV